MTLRRREFIQVAATLGASLAWGGAGCRSRTNWRERMVSEHASARVFATLVGQMMRAGLSASDARGFVVSLLGMLADTAQHTPDAAFGRLVEEHQTKGGLNERVRATLLEQRWFDQPRAALNATTTLGYKKLG